MMFEKCMDAIPAVAGLPGQASDRRSYRTEVLDCYFFESLQEVRPMTKDWLHRYNCHRPHESLGQYRHSNIESSVFPNFASRWQFRRFIYLQVNF